MPVPTIDLLPEVPIRGAPTFSPQMNLFLSALPTFQTQTNASIGAINTAVTDVQADVDAAAASASSASGFATTAVNAKNDAVQAKEDAQDILVLVENIAAGISFTSTSTTSLTVEVGSKTWTVQTDESYGAGMPIAAVKVGDPDVYMVGICTAYTGDQLTVAVSQVKGSGSVSNWNISIGGIPGLPGPSFTGGTLTSAMNLAPPATIASGSTVAIGAATSNLITISGTTTITAFDSIAAGAERKLTFSGALTLTHNGTSLILPGAANVTTEAGDTATFVSLGSGNWRCVDYQRASGEPLLGGKIIRDARTANTQLAASDKGKSIEYTTGGFTQTLAACSSLGVGWFVYVVNSSTGDVTFDPNGSETIGGVNAATTAVLKPGQSAILITDGTNLYFAGAPTSFRNMEIFISGGTFTPKPGVSRYYIKAVGGGGGGSYGGGAAGGYAEGWADITSPQTITIGGGGAPTNPGGTTTVGSIITCNGGNAGATSNGGGPSSGGTATFIGGLTIQGADGGGHNNGGSYGGSGGGSQFGGAGNAANNSNSGTDASSNSGSGGGGNAIGSGGNGGSGLVLIMW